MQGSGFFRLGWQDLVRGLVVAVLGAVLTAAQQAWSNNVDPTTWDWRTIGGIALGAGIAYLAKNLLSTEDGKFAGKIGAWAQWALLVGLLGLSACGSSGGTAPGGPVTGGDAVDPCAQAGQILAGSSLAISSAQAGYAILVAAGTIKPSTSTDLAIAASFDAANTALAQASADRLAGRCDVTSYTLAINKAVAQASAEISAARAAAAAAKAAQAAGKPAPAKQAAGASP
jgi:hypothetical protein